MLKYAQNKPLWIRLQKFNQHQVLSPTERNCLPASHGSSVSRHVMASKTPSFFKSVQILKSSVNNIIIHVEKNLDNLNPWNDKYIKIFITTGTRRQILCDRPSGLDDSHSGPKIPEDIREAYAWRCQASNGYLMSSLSFSVYEEGDEKAGRRGAHPYSLMARGTGAWTGKQRRFQPQM